MASVSRKPNTDDAAGPPLLISAIGLENELFPWLGSRPSPTLSGRTTLAEWMIFLSLILYLLTIAPVKAAGYKTFDNSNPRDPAFYKTGIAARALGEHTNGIETFPFFAGLFAIFFMPWWRPALHAG